MNAAWEKQCYGITENDFMESIDESITMKLSDTRAEGLLKCAMSIASDAQEEIARDMKDEARQTVNRVKLLIDKAMAAMAQDGPPKQP